MTKNEKREHGDVLYEAILTLKDLEECKNCLLYTSFFVYHFSPFSALAGLQIGR